MFTKEEIDSWNEIFPNCKIKQSDLTCPTEPFLTKTLTSYLRMFGYDTNAAPQQKAEVDSSTERRLFLIKLAYHIDYFLKITDKSYSFTVYDLLHPTPKKTWHMLRILLNYLYYFNMYKTEVFTKAGEAIRKRDELFKRVKELQDENLNEKAKIEKVKEEICMFSEKLPIAKSKIIELKALRTKQTAEIQEMEAELKEINGKLEELNSQKRNLKKKIVSDCEARDLQSQLQQLKDKIEEQNQEEVKIKATLKANAENYNLTEIFLKQITEVQESLPLHQMDLLRDADKQLKEIKLTYSARRQEKQDLIAQIEKEQSEFQGLENKRKMLKKQAQAEKSRKLKLNEELEKIQKTLMTKISNLGNELDALNTLREEQEDISSYLIENIDILMMPYMRKDE